MSYLDFDYLCKKAESNAFHKCLNKLRCRSLDGRYGKAPTKREMKRMVERENKKTIKYASKSSKGFI
jgi:hypothetical protein